MLWVPLLQGFGNVLAQNPTENIVVSLGPTPEYIMKLNCITPTFIRYRWWTVDNVPSGIAVFLITNLLVFCFMQLFDQVLSDSKVTVNPHKDYVHS